MQIKYNDIEDNDQEGIMSMIGPPPRWITKLGIKIILLVLILFFVLGWAIKSPDTVRGTITVSSNNPLVKIESSIDGRIAGLYHRNGIWIQRGQLIAEFENVITKKNVDLLKEYLKEVNYILNNHTNTILDIPVGSFGIMQVQIDEINMSLRNLQLTKNDPYFDLKLEGAQEKLKYKREIILMQEELFKLNEKDLEMSETIFKIQWQLYQSKSISKMEFMEHESSLRNKKAMIKQSRIISNQNRLDIQSIMEEILNLRFEKRNALINLSAQIKSLLNQVNSALEEWELRFLIRAPRSGILTYIQDVQEFLNVSKGSLLFAIIPEETSYTGKVDINSGGIGKVRIGNKVIVKFNNYPKNEFGSIIARVESISMISNNDLNYVSVSFPNGLTTNYSKTLTFKGEMKGEVEIVTQNKRIIQKIINGIDF